MVLWYFSVHFYRNDLKDLDRSIFMGLCAAGSVNKAIKEKGKKEEKNLQKSRMGS